MSTNNLCRYFPTPSDRMSILWSLYSIKDAIVLEYGPAGTTYLSRTLYGKLGIEQQGRMFTTHMSEDDVVMGDVSRLEKAIIEVDQNTDVKVIFVVASSLSAVIGTDIKGVCLEIQDRVKAKLVAFDYGGLKGDYSVGLSETYKLLSKEFAKKKTEKKEKTYNVIGLSIGQYRAKSDLWEINQLMQEAFGYTMNACLCCDTTIADLENLGAADINLILRPEAIAAAKSLQKRCGTSYIEGSPYGYMGTLNWLREISKEIGVEINSKLEQRLLEKHEEIRESFSMYMLFRADIVKPTATIVGDYDRARGLLNIVDELLFDVNAVLCDHSLFYVEDLDDRIKHIPNEKERLAIYKNCENQVIFGDRVALHLSPQSNTKILVSAPFERSTRANHFPVMGEKGMDAITESIYLYISELPNWRRHG